MPTTLATLGATPASWDSAMLPDTYLLIEERHGGTLELFAIGDIQHQLPGDYYATLQTDGRPLDSCVVWEAGGFYVKEAS